MNNMKTKNISMNINSLNLKIRFWEFHNFIILSQNIQNSRYQANIDWPKMRYFINEN